MQSNLKTPLNFQQNNFSEVKLLTIKNFSPLSSKLPDDYQQQSWSTLEKAIQAIDNSKNLPVYLEELYRIVENLCTFNEAAFLYEKLKELIVNNTKYKAEKLYKESHSLSKYEFLRHMCFYWDQHCKEMQAKRSIFMYLDRTYVTQNRKLDSIWDLGIKSFYNCFVASVYYKEKLISGILHLINDERNGATIEKWLVKKLISMLALLKVYEEFFQKPFLKATKVYYYNEGHSLLERVDVHAYLNHVSQRLHEEQQRVLEYLESKTLKSLVAVVELELLKIHTTTLLERGFTNFLEGQHYDYLKIMYNLFERVGALVELKQHFSMYIKTKGSEIIRSTERENEMVEDLLKFKNQLDHSLACSFASNAGFKITLKDSFEVAINSVANKPSELLAKYIDRKLKQSSKNINEEGLDALFDKVIVLFRSIQGKDVFEAFYKKDLAKRLLLERSLSLDAERSMLSKLKQECGSNFTYKLEGMFNDLETSKILMTSFVKSEWYSNTMKNFSVNVLTAGHWPSYSPSPNLAYPEQVQLFRKNFCEFYTSTNPNRKLTWVPSLEQCTLKVNLARDASLKEEKELYVSCSQAIVLLLFNEKEQFSYHDVSIRTGLDEATLKHILQTLTFGKVKLLLKEPDSFAVTEHCIFTLKKELKTKSKKVRINQLQIKDTLQEQEDTTQRVYQDRQWQIDAAVVRIMKTRRMLSHNELLQQLFQQLKFPATVQDVKKRLESLIERDYISKEENNDCINYHYVA